jgi:aldehyde dehydrogenase (NAD+)
MNAPSPAVAPTLPDLDERFARLRAARPALRATTARERVAKLRRLQRALLERQEAFRAALMADFRKHPTEVDMTEILPVTSEIKHVCAHLGEWMAPRRVGTPVSLIGTRSEIRCEPRGACLIISPWNFPVNLTLIPLVSAVAAGNAVVLKPSEYAPRTAAELEALVAEVFDPAEAFVVQGDHTAAQALLALPFDHVFFTGSPRVGRLVMQAAAEHLTSVTLELGGKSPAIVDRHADVAQAAMKVAWGKTLNAGQTCIAPDYALVHEDLVDDFVAGLDAQWTVQYGATDAARQQSESLARIINDQHTARLADLLDDALDKGAEAVVGGTVDRGDRFVAPTVLRGVTPEMGVLQEELFGPVLPVLPYRELDEAIAWINGRPKPLALYAFSRRNSVVDRILSETSSGGATVNDCILHFLNPNMPFGGVNNSGMGQSHGQYGFETFSHQRSVLRQGTRYAVNKLLYPPYTRQVDQLVDLSIKFF